MAAKDIPDFGVLDFRTSLRIRPEMPRAHMQLTDAALPHVNGCTFVRRTTTELQAEADRTHAPLTFIEVQSAGIAGDVAFIDLGTAPVIPSDTKTRALCGCISNGRFTRVHDRWVFDEWLVRRARSRLSSPAPAEKRASSRRRSRPARVGRDREVTMRALILSDIHGNIDALRAVEARVRGDHFDEIWVLGDLVDYGGAPQEVVEWVRARATRVVRGNHDHAMGTGEDCRSAPPYHDLAVATRDHDRALMPADALRYLASLPLLEFVAVSPDARGVLVHASPRDPLFGYIPTRAPDPVWQEAIAPAIGAQFVFVGHTHDQFTRRVGSTLIVNPGSVGLPKDGDARAAFAILRDETISLERAAYDTARAAARLERVPLTGDQRRRLTSLILHASLD